MFLYRPPKAMCWGHAARPKDRLESEQSIDAFFDKYFERIEPDEQKGAMRTFKLNWKSSALPNAEWPEYFLKPENKHLRLIMFILMRDRISFPLGIVFRFRSRLATQLHTIIYLNLVPASLSK
jgi:hypothetical protein